MLRLRLAKVVNAVRAHHHRNGSLYQALQQGHVPAKRRCGNPGRADRMAGVVIAVTEPPLAVFPGFSPLNGGKAEEKCTWGKRSQQPSELFNRKFRTKFQSMFLRRVMI